MWDGQLGLEGYDLAGGEGLDARFVVGEGGAAAEEEVTYEVGVRYGLPL